MAADDVPPTSTDATPPAESQRAPGSGFTVPEAARRWRVGESKVIGFIRRGELRAVNVAAALCGRPRFVIPPDALAEFEKARAAAQPKPTPRRRRRPLVKDYYPD